MNKSLPTILGDVAGQSLGEGPFEAAALVASFVDEQAGDALDALLSGACDDLEQAGANAQATTRLAQMLQEEVGRYLSLTERS